MAKPFQVHVFGKKGCEKCGVLNQRLDKLTESVEWQDFEKVYRDVETEEGIIAFCQAECINPQRIPAFLIQRLNSTTDRYEPVPNRAPGEADNVCGGAKLYQYLGLQTDYSESGRGLITPKMIKACLNEARTTAQASA